MFTIFEIENARGKGGRQARFLLNRASTVRLGADGFVSGPRKGNSLKKSVCDHGGWIGSLSEAQAKCRADKNCGFVHDANCDGRGWRYCSGLADEQATGLAMACIKVKGGGSDTTVGAYSFRNPPNFMPLDGEALQYGGRHEFNHAFHAPQVSAILAVLLFDRG